MRKRWIAGVAIIVGVALTGCQSAPQAVQNKEDLLAAAGFVPQVANSPARITSMKKLPPNKFVQQTQGTNLVYVYADPVVCQCVYLGSQAAYAQYRSMVFQQNLADERQMNAIMAQNAFDFGPWGGPLWGPMMY